MAFTFVYKISSRGAWPCGHPIRIGENSYVHCDCVGLEVQPAYPDAFQLSYTKNVNSPVIDNQGFAYLEGAWRNRSEVGMPNRVFIFYS